jgi:hypothetical protein
MGSAMSETIKVSPKKGLMLARGILRTATSHKKLDEDARQMVAWARWKGWS